MASVYKRKEDRTKKGAKWIASWKDEAGKWRQRVAYADKAASLDLARHLEEQANRVRTGQAEPGEQKRREASLKPVAAHIEDYRLSLLARGDVSKHANHVAGVLLRLLDDAAVTSIAEMAPDRIEQALGRLRVSRTARTVNHALGAVKAFAKWLVRSKRIKESTVEHLKPVSGGVLAGGERYQRRSLTADEFARLLKATESGPVTRLSPKSYAYPLVEITGSERAILYRIAAATGFRANELRSLVPESFNLEGNEPTITVTAAYTKNGKTAVQPIPRALADLLRSWLATRESGKPVLPVPTKTAKLLKRDLIAAGIDPGNPKTGVIDFHALRHTYITHLVESGANVKLVQTLARHSTITLTLDRYTHVRDEDLRDVVEGKGKSS